MFSEDPFDANSDWTMASGVTCEWEVPDGTGGGNNELSAANDEGADPETAEQMVDENVSGLFTPFHLSNKWERGISWLNISNWEDKEAGDYPCDHPSSNDYYKYYWDYHYSGCVVDEIWGRLNNGEAKSDSLAEAEQNKQVSASNAP